jgi:hypothetical protein
MKPFKLTKTTTQVALFAGATALLALTPSTYADTSVDALLNKLEQKGILSVDEAKQLKADNIQTSTNDFNQAFGSKFKMPDWVTGYKISGDFRGRFDELSTDHASSTTVGAANRDRFRYRLRFGLAVTMLDSMEAGFRLGSGDAGSAFGSGGNPLSNNTTFENDFTKKPIWVDTAYGKWTPVNNDSWLLSTTIGKMENPFQFTPMVFDPDLTPEGAALQSVYKFNSKHSLAFNGSAFVLDEEKTSTRDPMLGGVQVMWNAVWTPKLATMFGVGAFDIINREALTTANVPNNNNGNSRTGGGVLINDYTPVIVDGSATYKLDTFPFYTGAFPIKLAAEYMNNPGANANNQGYWAGVTFGKSGVKHTWDISYRYEYLQADAWYDQFVDDDNAAFYQTAPTAGNAGYVGGTNVKGHLIKLNYSLTDSVTLSFTSFFNTLVKPGLNTGGAGEPKNDIIHIMADVMWKF